MVLLLCTPFTKHHALEITHDALLPSLPTMCPVAKPEVCCEGPVPSEVLGSD